MQYYTELWKCLGKMTYSESQPLTYKRLNEVSQCLRDWYNGEGGLFFSQNSSLQYHTMMAKMAMVMPAEDNKEDNIVSRIHVTWIASQAGRLRSALARDIGTRRKSRLNVLKKFFGREEEIDIN